MTPTENGPGAVGARGAADRVSVGPQPYSAIPLATPAMLNAAADYHRRSCRVVPVPAGQKRVWASLSARPMLDPDGRHVFHDGKPQYAPILRWRTRDLAGRFSAAVVELVQHAHPDALDEAVP